MDQRFTPGYHVLLDFYHARGLCDLAFIDQTLRHTVQVCGATLLELKLHQFGHHGGISGIALLAESHISIHTWPERDFATLDIFMCGQCDARLAIAPLTSRFQPLHIKQHCILRGQDDVMNE